MTAFNIFKTDKKAKKPARSNPEVDLAPAAQDSGTDQRSAKSNIGTGTVGNFVLKNFYVSEKASRLLNQNQYVFEVAKTANKQEIKKQVQVRFNVKVVEVNVLNMPQKKRNVGRHPGVRSGFRKAIVKLAEGESIGQVKA